MSAPKPKTLEFFVCGAPAPQPRPRATVVGGRARIYNPKLGREWKDAVSFTARLASHEAGVDPLTGVYLVGPVELEMEFVLPRPKSHLGTGRNQGTLKKSAPQFHTTKPDCDNLAKGVADACSDVVYSDDRQITTMSISKRYSSPTEESGVWVRASSPAS